jgi:hypothetical protein
MVRRRAEVPPQPEAWEGPVVGEPGVLRTDGDRAECHILGPSEIRKDNSQIEALRCSGNRTPCSWRSLTTYARCWGQPDCYS